MENKAFISLKEITKIYPNGVRAVLNLNLDVYKHEFVTFVGPSGCGKSTTLRMIAGLEEISEGELYIGELFANYVPSKDRNIAMVFQSYALYPHLNVYDNISFGLKILRTPADEIKDRVYKAAKILDLGPYLDRLPKELSGGQMQRVALGRAIVRNADIFLMDEPLSNLDAKLRAQMRGEIIRIHKQTKATTIYVTHDHTEAMTMSDRIVVMNKSFIQQVGTPLGIYENPYNIFVATFIGSPPMNIMRANLSKNKVVFSNKQTLTLPRAQTKKIERFYRNIIDKYQEILKRGNEAELESLLAEIDAQKNIAKTDDEIKLPVAKPNVFHKIRQLFQRKQEEIKRESLYYEQVAELVENLKNAQNGVHEIIAGVRAEDVYLASANGDEKFSKEFSIDIDFIETLGAESIVNATFSDEQFTLKLSTKQLTNNMDTLLIKFDLDKIHLFDSLTGLNIMKGEER